MHEEGVAARSVGIPWDVTFRSFATSDPEASASLPPSGGVSPAIMRDWLRSRSEFYGDLASLEKQYDLILVRYSPTDPLLLRFMRRCKVKVGLVHHTITTREYGRSTGVANRLRGLAEYASQPLLATHCDVTVAVTREIAEAVRAVPGRPSPPTVILPNGIVPSDAQAGDSRLGKPELLFVASEFAPWHGLDLLLQDLPDVGNPFILHVVGGVSESLRALAGHDSRVTFHGSLTQKQIADVAASCWAGVSAMALERKGMFEACPLKVREYLNLGLPVIGSHADVFPDHFAYYTKATPRLADVLRACSKTGLVSRQQVALAARPFIDKSRILQDAYQELRTIFGAR